MRPPSHWIAITLAAGLVAGCGAKFDKSETSGEGGSTSSSGGSGGSTSSTASGGAGGGPVMAMPCNLKDDFDDNDLGAEWDPYGSVDSESGQVVVTLTPNEYEYHALWATNPLDMRGCAMWIEAVEVPPTVQGDVLFEILMDTANAVSVVKYYGKLQFREQVGDANEVVFETDYDPLAHRWWRMREADGRVHFGTSPNGLDWNEHASHPTPGYFSNAAFQAGGGTWDASSSAPGRIVWDNLNVPPP
jgi:hypothetical protein